MPEAWLTGPVPGIPQALMPAAHAFLDAAGELRRSAADLRVEELWRTPGGAASVGFHLRHVAGSTQRLLTYARGEALTPDQLAAIPRESEPGDPPATAPDLLADLDDAVSQALDALRATSPDTLYEARAVGRAGLPATVHGLLFHAAEHARRHAGQAIATAKFLRAHDEAARLLRAYDDAGIRGLCAEGRWEAAMGAVRGAR